MSQLVLISLAGACLISVCVVPITRALFRHFEIVDRPDKERKLHSVAVSLGGGLAVFLSVCITMALVFCGDQFWGGGLLRSISFTPPRWYVLFGASGILMLVGLLDDAVGLRGRQKLVLQILVVVSVVYSGTLVQHVTWFGYTLSFGVFAYPLTMLWLLAAINALNLIDGADAVASTAGAIMSGGLAILCLQTGHPLGAVVAAALAGSLVGFLLYNRPPATIYLGDAGSMVIGLLIGVISIWSSVKGSTLLSFAPLMVLTLPLFDSAIAILRRVLTGRGIFATDRGHLHHRLLDRLSHRMMLLVVAGLCTLSTSAAIMSIHFGQQWIASGGVVLVLGLLVFTGSFGSAELRMFAARIFHFAQSLLNRNHRCESLVHHRSIQLQGQRCWDNIWLSLVEFASDRGLAQIQLDVGIAWMQEGYHGSWRRVRMPDKVDQACLKMPIFVRGRFVGRLEAIGDARLVDINHTLQLLIERSEDLDVQIERLMEGEIETDRPQVPRGIRLQSSVSSRPFEVASG